ncbi:MAG: GNAT family N-acetyltransferase [Candidatus Thorarchaeota archaeon]|jgi:ribosomal protein S18 acetylase RimI-like enzyme
MVKIVIRKWEDMDIRQLAEMTRETRQYERLGDYTVDQVEEYLRNMNERFPIESALVAKKDKQILGWMGIERVTEQIGEIGRWQPFVGQQPERNEVAQQLISGVNRYARENGIKRMEIGFGDVSEANSDTFKQRQLWYESEDWSKLEDDYFMVTNPTEDHQVQEPTIPEGFKLRPLSEVDKDKLFLCYREAFMTGQALWIYDMTEEQRREEFDKNFSTSRPINNKASFAAEQNGEVAGFILVLSRSEEEEHVESFGVHPSFRGKGLAKMMLWKVIKVLRQTKSENLTLGVDSVNSPAISLYERFGFETVSRTIRYSWKDDA